MKKLSVLAITFAAVMFAACSGQKTAQNAAEADSAKSFEQQQIEAGIKMHLDSIAADLGQLKQLPFLSKDENGITLTKEEKQVKPDYLIPANAADEAATLAEKYRILSALNVDREIATLYEMPTDEYDKAITKLAADINDPSFKVIDNANTLFETSSALYDAMNENGRVNYFWQLAAAALVEELYVMNQNSEKFLSVFTDKAADDVTFRIVVILDALQQLTTYDADMKPVADAVAPLSVLNATSVAQLKTQLDAAKDQIVAARKALVK